MCYATSLTKKEKQIEKRFDASMKIELLYEPYYYQNGFSHNNLFCIPIEDPTQIFPMEWGLVPSYSDENIEGFRKKYNTLNARSESVFNNVTYKKSAEDSRCLIIADGFFEPHYPNNNFKGSSEPKYCYLENRKLFTFAGIYNKLDTDYYTVSILTTQANPFFEEIHNKKKRMPLVLDPNVEGEWLNDSLTNNQVKELMIDAFIKESFHAHTVRNIYKRGVDHNVPEVLEPVEGAGEQASLF